MHALLALEVVAEVVCVGTVVDLVAEEGWAPEPVEEGLV